MPCSHINICARIHDFITLFICSTTVTTIRGPHMTPPHPKLLRPLDCISEPYLFTIPSVPATPQSFTIPIPSLHSYRDPPSSNRSRMARNPSFELVHTDNTSKSTYHELVHIHTVHIGSRIGVRGTRGLTTGLVGVASTVQARNGTSETPRVIGIRDTPVLLRCAVALSAVSRENVVAPCGVISRRFQR